MRSGGTRSPALGRLGRPPSHREAADFTHAKGGSRVPYDGDRHRAQAKFEKARPFRTRRACSPEAWFFGLGDWGARFHTHSKRYWAA